MLAASAVGRAVVGAGVDHVFGVVGSGNFHVTNAMTEAGATYVAARHEGGAATMADAYARVSGRPSALTLHQGCGLTNAMTGIAEAAKSRTPMVVLAAEAGERRSNFFVDQTAMALAVGAVPHRITSGDAAAREAREAVRVAVQDRCTVVLNLPLAVQSQECDEPPVGGPFTAVPGPAPSSESVERLAAAVMRATRPVFVAGRGARSHGNRLRRTGELAGALLAESAVAKGLFHEDAWSIGVSGGFSSPGAARLIRGADLIVGWGCSLNMWTMRHGRLIGPDTTVVQVDDTAASIGAHRDLDFGVLGDVGLTADALSEALTQSPAQSPAGYRTEETRSLIDASLAWRDVAYDDRSGGGLIDPRSLSIALDDLLPRERIVGVDSGNFMGYPSMFLSVPDEQGFCFTQAFQSIGLGLATTIGAALARPDRLPVAALGDGGALMSAMELETVGRLGLPMVVVVYNDHAYGAEVHHFGPDDLPLDTVTFPDTDVAAIARGFGFEALSVRSVDDLAEVGTWLAGGRSRPLLVDAKVVDREAAWWLEEAFRGH